MNQAVQLATDLGDSASVSTYTQRAATLKQAINARLYNASNGYYGVSAANLTSVAQDASALAVLSGVAPQGSAPSILAKLAQHLAKPYGGLAFSSDSGRTAVLSPFASDMEVRARFASGDTSGALDLIGTLWGNMVAAGDNYTGTTWEALHRRPAGQLGDQPRARLVVGSDRGVVALRARRWACGPRLPAVAGQAAARRVAMGGRDGADAVGGNLGEVGTHAERHVHAECRGPGQHLGQRRDSCKRYGSGQWRGHDQRVVVLSRYRWRCYGWRRLSFSASSGPEVMRSSWADERQA